MKKITILVIMVAVFSLYASMVYAKNEGVAIGNSEGNTVQNQNELQNAGEERDLMYRAEDQNNELENEVEPEDSEDGEDLMYRSEDNKNSTEPGKSASPRSEKARENMSVVAKGVEMILTTKTLKGGIGDQVREIARAQNQDQDQTEMHLGSVDNRKGLIKSLIGPDFKALKSLEKQIEQNQLRIEQLTEMKNQLTNQGDIVMVQEMIDALIQQNTSLQEVIDSESQVRSMFGWLIKLFAK